MALHEALFAAAAAEFFAPGRLSLAFVSGDREFERLAVDEWDVREASARGVVVWTVPASPASPTVAVRAVRLYDGDKLVEERLMRDSSGTPGVMTLLGGQEFEFGYSTELTQVED